MEKYYEKSNLLQRVQVECFKAIFSGLTACPGNSIYDAFLRSVMLTSDQNFEEIIKHRSKPLIKYLEMIKGNILNKMYYGPRVNETRQNIKALEEVDKTLIEIKKCTQNHLIKQKG